MATIELEAPIETAQHYSRAALHVVSPEAEAAVRLLEGSDTNETTDGSTEPQRDGSTEIKIRLTRAVSDATAGFEGAAGDTYDGYVDVDGNTWLPLLNGDICLEAEEFEVVEPLASQDETEAAATETIAVEPETIPPAAETVETPQSPPTRVATHWGEYARRRADYLRTKDVLQEQISALMIEQQKLREQAKRCKKEAEVYVEQLTELIENWEHPAADVNTTTSTEAAGGCGVHATDQSVPDITQTEPASQPGEPQTATPTPPAVQSEAAAASQYEDSLRAVSLESLGIGGKLIEKLQSERVITIWDWEDLRKAIGIGKMEWPKGVGEKKREDVDARIGDWVAKNSHRWTPVAERAVDVAESQPATPSPAISTDIDDL